jgi:hypothetical protein
MGHIKGTVRPYPVNLKTYSEKSESPLQDTVFLIADYSDPFLDRPLLKSTSTTREVSFSMNRIAFNPAKENFQWPLIRYGGIIINKNSKTALCLIQIEGKNQLTKAGETFNEIKLIMVYEDSIIVQLKNHKKTIAKEKL